MQSSIVFPALFAFELFAFEFVNVKPSLVLYETQTHAVVDRPSLIDIEVYGGSGGNGGDDVH